MLWADILLSNLGLPRRVPERLPAEHQECNTGPWSWIRRTRIGIYWRNPLKSVKWGACRRGCITEQPLKELAEEVPWTCPLSTEAGKARGGTHTFIPWFRCEGPWHLPLCFEPVQHEIGRLWQINHISVAHEHYCTSVTQMIMSELYPYATGLPRGKTWEASCHLCKQWASWNWNKDG